MLKTNRSFNSVISLDQ